MAFEKKDIEHLAKLARLHVADEEVDRYREQIGAVLEYVEKLQELDTEDVEELAHAAGAVNVFRADEAQKCATEVRERALDRFPQREGDLLEVEAVFDERTE